MQRKGDCFGWTGVAWDGEKCVVVWTRYHFGGPQGMSLVNGDIMAGRVMPDYSLPDQKSPVGVATTSADELTPALASNGAGNLLCIYQAKRESGEVR